MSLPPPVPFVSFVFSQPSLMFFFFVFCFLKPTVLEMWHKWHYVCVCACVNMCFSSQSLWWWLFYSMSASNPSPSCLSPPLFHPLVFPADTSLSEDSGGHMFDIVHNPPISLCTCTHTHTSRQPLPAFWVSSWKGYWLSYNKARPSAQIVCYSDQRRWRGAVVLC